MKKVKVIIDFSHTNVPVLIATARNIVAKMTGNSLFPKPDVAIAQLTEAANVLETKYNTAQDGGKQQTLEMNQARKALDTLLHKQGMYVDRIADGNELSILSSGFDASKQPTAAAHPDFTVITGQHEGAVTLKHKAVKDAAAYVWQTCTDPASDANWVYAAFSTQATVEIQDLKPAVKYWFRCAAITKTGLGNWCDMLGKIVV